MSAWQRVPAQVSSHIQRENERPGRYASHQLARRRRKRVSGSKCDSLQSRKHACYCRASAVSPRLQTGQCLDIPALPVGDKCDQPGLDVWLQHTVHRGGMLSAVVVNEHGMINAEEQMVLKEADEVSNELRFEHRDQDNGMMAVAIEPNRCIPFGGTWCDHVVSWCAALRRTSRFFRLTNGHLLRPLRRGQRGLRLPRGCLLLLLLCHLGRIFCLWAV
eukprot:1116454-Prymnesium_polylepis.1